jgi:uncharacterized protein (DUF302 family)
MKKRLTQLGLLMVLAVLPAILSAQAKDYYFSRTVDLSFEETLESTKASLKDQGFGIITEIEMDKTLKEKLENVDMKRYTILGACNPKYAYQTLQEENNIGLFLPCKVLVKEIGEGATEVVMVNPTVLMQMLGNKELEEIAREVTERFERALNDID